MRAIDRTSRDFVRSLRDEVPDAKISVERYRSDFGRSYYVHIRDGSGTSYWKVRISDHQIGMRRAMSGREEFYISAGDSIDRWAAWLGEFKRKFNEAAKEADNANG